MRQLAERLQDLLDSVIQTMGYELLGVELSGGRSHSLMRIYIDQAAGITVDDCQQVSQQVSAALDVEEPIAATYTLEVSSPGLDRPLFKAAHFARFAGQNVSIKLHLPQDGKRKIRGLLKGMRDAEVVVDVEGTEWHLPLDAIATARLAPEF